MAARNNVSKRLGNLFEVTVVIYTSKKIKNLSDNKHHT